MAPGGRDFNCSWENCGKSFNRKSDLCRHYRIHTNERPYNCTVKDCKKNFIQRSALTVHSRTHTGEKPHVCDHDDCQKAFSDSSSLARHRRIHTGRRPYICQESTCERSFCRKTTLTKHQLRSHPPVSMTRPSLEDANSEHSYHQHQPRVSVSVPKPNDQYLLAQQPSYPNSATPNDGFYSPPNVQMGSVPIHEGAHPIVTHNVPVTSPINMPHAPPQAPTRLHPQRHPQHQQYLQIMQQRHGLTSRKNCLPPVYHQPPFQDHRSPDGQPIMVGYNSNFQQRGNPA